MDVVIITGASKGIGQELYKQFQDAGSLVYGLARTNPNEWDRIEKVDVTNFIEATNVLRTVLNRHKEEAESFTLINNAGVIDPIGLVGALDSLEVERAIHVNLTAPIQLVNTFIETLESYEGTKKVLNISSGAGRTPYEGWSIYCTTKAGLDHFSRVVAEEQRKLRYPTGIVSIAPGIIDTGMQETIRSASNKQFPHLQKFISYKKEGLLSTPEYIASNILRFVQETNFVTADTIADIRHIK
ncbi:SDR family NAD(P)-dependent oxidoreductase [Sporosarcina sp. PTS2304]|uniref:SDR family NAD(P)-dependent oxidoreductase n=1 Tax=Sporosarcina sp. PTS2304 TaxID=2283194 RepID=UPI000E0DBBA5|nr:SDR family NAD(P)-dependent oxidoreductase [Sporosarcina sp. PTS2304]AXH99506.1 SDR family NAD(P)-dependent oxidoreductase [Sporosarcina sp. PTS2304]